MELQLADPTDLLSFLTELPPPLMPAGTRHDDAFLHEGAAARRIRELREAELELLTELKAATKEQLYLARKSLRSKLTAAGAAAIERFVTRLARLVLRLVSAGFRILPQSNAERRAVLAHQTLQQVDAELQRRSDSSIASGASSGKTVNETSEPVKAVEKLQIVRSHDARCAARALDGADCATSNQNRERNRS